MIFDLVRDFADAFDAMPREHPRYRILELLNEAIRRDVHFIARHREDYPQALFQSLWNSCWWYDCPEAASHYDLSKRTGKGPLPWELPGEQRLTPLLERWRAEKAFKTPDFAWLRLLRPPAMHLETAQKAVFRGHEGSVVSVAFSPDDRQIVSGSWDKTVRVWDTATGRQLKCLRGYERAELDGLPSDGVVVSLAFSPDSRQLVSGSMDGMVRVWDAVTWNALWSLRVHETPVTGVSFSPDGMQVVSGSRRDGMVRVWDAATGAELRCFLGLEGGVASVAFSPDSRQIIAGSMDGMVRAWDLATGTELRCLKCCEPDGTGLDFSPDGRKCVSSTDGWGSQLRVWDSATGTELCCLGVRRQDVTSVAFSPDGRQIVGGLNDESVRDAFMLTGTAALDGEPQGQHPGATVRVWDAATGADLRCFRGHEDDVHSVAFSPDGGRIVSGSGDQTVRVWDETTGAEIHCLRGHADAVKGVACSPAGRHLASWSNDRTVRVWDAATGVELLCLGGHESNVVGATFSPDGRRIATWSLADIVRIWDTTNGEVIHCLRIVNGVVQSAGFSPDGRRFFSRSGGAFGSDDVCVRVWDAATGDELSRLRSYNDNLGSVAFSPDGRQLVSGSDDKTVRTWDADSGDCLDVVNGSGDVAAIAAGASVFPYRCLLRGQETVIEAAAECRSIAWFSAPIGHIVTHPSGRVWAGAVANHVVLFGLEGESPFPVPYSEVPAPTNPFQIEQLLAPIIALLPASAVPASCVPFVPADGGWLPGDGEARWESDPAPGNSDRRGGLGSRPHPDADANLAAKMNIAYQERLAAWEALSWWKRLFTKRPERPTGI